MALIRSAAALPRSRQGFSKLQIRAGKHALGGRQVANRKADALFQPVAVLRPLSPLRKVSDARLQAAEVAETRQRRTRSRPGP